MNIPQFLPLTTYQEYPQDEMQRRAHAFAEEMQRRRTVREYSDRQVPREIITEAVRAAASAPSGANLQPWHFVIVEDLAVRKQIREGAEVEEREFYSRRATPEWLAALAPLGTDENKPFLETAPYLIAVFYQRYGLDAAGQKFKTYYAPESVGIATGLLIGALHHAGLATLTHTPSPMGFLREMLHRPINESPFLLLVTGYPAENVQVPNIQRKPAAEIMTVV
ncbi:MAG: nitroreductase family protein [Nevskia sp.]|jgi:nitroreductase|nr:nitroreductase family protein [Nevskia sp.]MCK9383585.1 nitroreductase family protein [Nevskia sp.]